MKKKIIKIFTFLFVISLCPIVASNVSASDMDADASLYLGSYGAYVSSDGNGKVSVWFDVWGNETMDEIGALSISLQEKSSASAAWNDVKTYSHFNYPALLGSNTNYYYSHVSYSGTAGYLYRAYVTVWAGKNGGGDSRSVTTGTVVAQ
jgi:hypothetical protein